jgi:hypothetical protein
MHHRGNGGETMRRRIAFALAAVAALAALNALVAVRLGNDMGVEPAFQGDYREAVCVVAGRSRSVHSSGCGAVSAFMAIRHITGADAPDPEALFSEAYARGEYTGSGLGHASIARMLRENGVTAEWIGRSERRVRRALFSGRPVIAHMGEGTFTNDGHYILLTGVTPDGRIIVNDPGSRARTGGAYALELIFSEAKTDRPFCIAG